jgi:hypothetical protein
LASVVVACPIGRTWAHQKRLSVWGAGDTYSCINRALRTVTYYGQGSEMTEKVSNNGTVCCVAYSQLLDGFCALKGALRNAEAQGQNESRETARRHFEHSSYSLRCSGRANLPLIKIVEHLSQAVFATTSANIRRRAGPGIAGSKPWETGDSVPMFPHVPDISPAGRKIQTAHPCGSHLRQTMCRDLSF